MDFSKEEPINFKIVDYTLIFRQSVLCFNFRPRLGQTLHKVLAVGGLYFLLAAIEGCMRVHDGVCTHIQP